MNFGLAPNSIPVHCITPFCSDTLVSSPNLFPPWFRLRVVSNFGDCDCGAGKIHTRARESSRRRDATRRERRGVSNFRRSLCVASPRNFARVRVHFARPTIAIAKIRDYSQSSPGWPPWLKPSEGSACKVSPVLPASSNLVPRVLSVLRRHIENREDREARSDDGLSELNENMSFLCSRFPLRRILRPARLIVQNSTRSYRTFCKSDVEKLKKSSLGIFNVLVSATWYPFICYLYGG